MQMNNQINFKLPNIKGYERHLVAIINREEQELKDLNIDDYINQVGKILLAKLDECRVSLKTEQERLLKEALEVGSSQSVDSTKNSTNTDTGNLNGSITTSQSDTPN